MGTISLKTLFLKCDAKLELHYCCIYEYNIIINTSHFYKCYLHKIHWDYKIGIYLELPLEMVGWSEWHPKRRKIYKWKLCLKVDLCNTNRFVLLPFCSFAPMSASVCFSFHSFTMEKPRLQLWERIDCWQAADFRLQPFILAKVTYEIWGSRVRLLQIRFGIFGLHFIVNIILSLIPKFHPNPFSGSRTMMLKSSANLLATKSV